MLSLGEEHYAHVLQMLCLRATEDEDVIEGHQDITSEEGFRISFIRTWKVDGVLVMPKGITKNSK